MVKTELRCNRCGETKPVSMFWKNKYRSNGYQTYCTSCSKELKAMREFERKESVEGLLLVSPESVGRVCCRCKKYKTYDEMLKVTRGGGMSSFCLECSRSYAEYRKAPARELIAEWKSAGCAACGEKEHCCLSAHHRDPSQKEFWISRSMTLRRDRLKAELDKCVCVCENCHRKIHAGIIDCPP